jgi:PAS domain S-box-containing protein
MLPHGILLLDQDQKILYINKMLLDSLGYKREELIGQPAKKILHEDERFFGLAWQTVDENKVLERSKVQFLSKNKESVSFYFSGAVAMDGGETVGFIGLGTPIENVKTARETNENK